MAEPQRRSYKDLVVSNASSGGRRMFVIPPSREVRLLPPTLLQPEEVAALIEACKPDPAGLRTRAIIGVLYRTGITVGEAVALNESDIDLKAASLNVAGHGRLQSRTLGLDPSAISLLEGWCAERTRFQTEPLFCTVTQNPGKRLDTNDVRIHLRQLAPKAKLRDLRVHPHGLRHSFAAELLVEQWPLPHIQVQLGFSSLRGLEQLLGHLEVRLPAEEDVAAVARTRDWG